MERRLAPANAVVVIDYPEGSPQLAAYIHNNSDMLIIRKFGYLHVRVLLDLQSEIAGLETTVHNLDVYDSVHNPNALKSRGVNEGRVVGKSRQELLQKIQEKLVLYRKHFSGFSSSSFICFLTKIRSIGGKHQVLRISKDSSSPDLQRFCESNNEHGGYAIRRTGLPPASCRYGRPCRKGRARLA